ncbi:hypothetical protein YTPLAS18_20540 [Nitrospira sp.]|nr:hypothetical protein YTPLAS18_20540 [Nitrospira sp.]
MRNTGDSDSWCFTLEWLNRDTPKRRPYSLNLFEEDLAHFEVFEGPIPTSPSFVRQRRVTAARKERPLQIPLPFVRDH